MMQDRTFRGQSADGVWHEGFLIRSPGVKNSRPGEGWYINSEQEPAYAHLVKPFTIGMSTGVKDMEGTMVFEGDIIKTTGSNERIFSVEFGEYIAYGVSHIGFYAKIAGIHQPVLRRVYLDGGALFAEQFVFDLHLDRPRNVPAAIALAAPCGRRDSNVLDLADRRAEQAGHNAVLSILADPCPVHLAHPAVIGHAQFFDCLLRGNCFSPFHFFCSSPASFIRYGVSLMFPTTFPM